MEEDVIVIANLAKINKMKSIKQIMEGEVSSSLMDKDIASLLDDEEYESDDTLPGRSVTEEDVIAVANLAKGNKMKSIKQNMEEEVSSSLMDRDITSLLDEKEYESDDSLPATSFTEEDIIAIANLAKINKMKIKEESLLRRAAFTGRTSRVKLLVSKGADIEGIDDRGLTPLHVACREGHLEIVKFLFSKGGDINRQTFDGMTPFAMATKRGHVEVLKYLISKEVEIERSDNRGWTPLIWACARGLLSTANYLLHVGADADGPAKGGWTALHFSIHFDRLDVIKSLVSAGADLNWPDEDGNTPLHIACFDGRIQILKYLLNNGADLQKADFDGTTSLHSASAEGHHNVVSFILQQKEGSELLNRPDAKGKTPLHVATSHGFTSIIDTLVSRGGDLNAQTNEGQTCLHLAAKLCEGSTNVEVTKDLSKLRAGNSKEALGPAPALVKHLIRKGADVNIADKAEKNPLEYLSLEMANLVVSEEPTESHALGGRQPGVASYDADGRTGSKVDSKTHPGKGEPSPTGSSALSDQVLLRLSEEMPIDKVLPLGINLGLEQPTVARFEATNAKGTLITSIGTRAMLFEWFNDTTGAKAIPTLRGALEGSGLARLADKYLQQFN